jgi:hypothetical protein
MIAIPAKRLMYHKKRTGFFNPPGPKSATKRRIILRAVVTANNDSRDILISS